MDTVYRVCVEKSDGEQLDYNSLASKSNGPSKYLIVPTQFPSMMEDEKDDEEVGVEEIKEQ